MTEGTDGTARIRKGNGEAIDQGRPSTSWDQNRGAFVEMAAGHYAVNLNFHRP